MSDNPKLSSCPFCGAVAPAIDYSDKHPLYSVVCIQCNAVGPASHDVNDAINQWNAIFATPKTELDFHCSEASATTQRVVRQLLDRDAAGKQKYGTTLDRDDLTTLEWLQHAQEEALDLAGYLEVLKGRCVQRVQESSEPFTYPAAPVKETAKSEHVTRLETALSQGSHIVYCLMCSASSPTSKSIAGAIEAWNRRPAEDARQWQPMETAPRDGSEVLLFDRVCRVQRVAVWVRSQQMWFTDQGRGGYWDSDFSHWMPLPEPPTAPAPTVPNVAVPLTAFALEAIASSQMAMEPYHQEEEGE